MRTNIELDDKLIARVMKKTGATTKREAVHIALREIVKEPPDYTEVLKMFGSGSIDPHYDPKNPAADLPKRRTALRPNFTAHDC